MPSKQSPMYNIREQVHSEHKHIKIIHVGAGASGLLTAYKARKVLKNYELVCYDKYTPRLLAPPMSFLFLTISLLSVSKESYHWRYMVGE